METEKGREFEKYVEERLRRLYPGYACMCQKSSKTTRRRPDCFCVLKKKRGEK
jgi:hypothetical protein